MLWSYGIPKCWLYLKFLKNFFSLTPFGVNSSIDLWQRSEFKSWSTTQRTSWQINLWLVGVKIPQVDDETWCSSKSTGTVWRSMCCSVLSLKNRLSIEKLKAVKFKAFLVSIFIRITSMWRAFEFTKIWQSCCLFICRRVYL